MIAHFLGVLGSLRELFASLVGGRLVVVALGGLAPGLDLLFPRGFQRGIRGRAGLDGHRVGGSAKLGGADRLCLEERPEVGGLDILAESFGLRTFAERLGEGEEQREQGDQECDPAISAAVSLFLGMFGGFVGSFVRFRHEFLPRE